VLDKEGGRMRLFLERYAVTVGYTVFFALSEITAFIVQR
jgi:hypothetical protein